MIKTKTCEKCSKVASPAKTLTVNGVRTVYCEKCLGGVSKQLKLEKNKINREKKKLAKSISKESLMKDMQLLVRLLGGNTCVTCEAEFNTSKHLAHGGHFRSRRFGNTAFLIENINKQCAYCNSPMGGKGEEWKHGIYIDELWGKGSADKLHKMSKVNYKLTKDVFMDMREKLDKWLELARMVSDEDKEHFKKEIKNWQENQYWYKEILKLTNQ